MDCDPNWQATIIGVVADHHVSWKRSNGPLVYTSAQQANRSQAITFYVRTAGASLNEQKIRAIVRRQAPGVAVFDVQSMPVRMAEFASGDRAMALLIGSFSVLALVITLVGIYGVVAYSSTLRTPEFGVRFALGARRPDILWLVFREVTVIIAAGLVLALPAAWFGLSIARNQLYHVTLHDPLVFGIAIPAVILCSCIAAAVPAARVAGMNIQTALRHN